MFTAGTTHAFVAGSVSLAVDSISLSWERSSRMTDLNDPAMPPEQTLYVQLGGEAGLTRLVESFYLHIGKIPEAKPLKDLHPEDLTVTKEKLVAFLSGWSGGPALFHERYGDPKLRMRHLRFGIGKAERDLWLQCMLHALEDLGVDEHVRYFAMDAFLKVADHMRNKPS
jgi:hemoglobin